MEIGKNRKHVLFKLFFRGPVQRKPNFRLLWLAYNLRLVSLYDYWHAESCLLLEVRLLIRMIGGAPEHSRVFAGLYAVFQEVLVQVLHLNFLNVLSPLRFLSAQRHPQLRLLQRRVLPLQDQSFLQFAASAV